MDVASPRALILSLISGIALSVVFGSLYSWMGDRLWVYGVGTMLFIFGVIALCMGLLGAVEPPEGWATRKPTQGRRSFAAQIANSGGDGHQGSPYALAVWGVLVGGPMIGLALLAFSRSV